MTTPNIEIHSGRGTETLRITVSDEISGQTLASVTLDQKQIWDMLGGGILHVAGEVVEPRHVHRIGKVMRTDSVIYGRDDLKASTYEQMLEDAAAMAKADRPGWEVYSPRRTNAGTVHVVMRRWE